MILLALELSDIIWAKIMELTMNFMMKSELKMMVMKYILQRLCHRDMGNREKFNIQKRNL
jgi:hypothetical protein